MLVLENGHCSKDIWKNDPKQFGDLTQRCIETVSTAMKRMRRGDSMLLENPAKRMLLKNQFFHILTHYDLLGMRLHSKEIQIGLIEYSHVEQNDEQAKGIYRLKFV